MSKKRYLVIALVILLLTSVAFADEREQEEKQDIKEVDLSKDKKPYGDGDNYPAITDNPSFDPKDVPAEYIEKVPPDKLGDVNELSKDQQAQLTADQLIYGGNLNKIADWSDLDQESVTKAASGILGVPVDVEGATNGNVDSDIIKLPTVDYFKVRDIEVRGATNVEYSPSSGILRLDSAESTIVGDSELTNLQNLLALKTNFKVESADEVKLGCAKATNVKDSNFAVDEISFAITLDSNVSYQIEDCGKTRYEYRNLGPGNNVIRFTKTQNPVVFMQNVAINLTKEIDGEVFTEELVVEGNANVDIHKNLGITRAELNKASYFYKTGSFDSDFVIRGERNTLFLIKDVTQQEPQCDDCSSMNFLTNEMKIDGSIEYKRYWVQNDGKVFPGAQTVFKSPMGGKARLIFDDQLDIIDLIEIQENNPPYVIQPNNYIRIEERNNATITEKYLKVSEVNKNTVSRTLVRKYTTTYSSEVNFEDGLTYNNGKAEIRAIDVHKAEEYIENNNEYFNQPPIIGIALLGLLIPWGFKKKGGITIFMILGILILFTVGTVFYISGELSSFQRTQKITSLQTFYDAVDDFTEQSNLCIDEVGKGALRKLGMHGGYLEGNTTINSNNLLNNVPTKEEIEKRTSQLIEANFGTSDCIKNLKETAEKRGLTVTAGESKAITTITKEGVSIELNYPVTLEARAIEGATNKIEEYATLIQYGVGKTVDNSKLISTSYLDTDGFVNIDVLITDTQFFPYKDKIHVLSEKNSGIELYKIWYTVE